MYTHEGNRTLSTQTNVNYEDKNKTVWQKYSYMTYINDYSYLQSQILLSSVKINHSDQKIPVNHYQLCTRIEYKQQIQNSQYLLSLLYHSTHTYLTRSIYSAKVGNHRHFFYKYIYIYHKKNLTTKHIKINKNGTDFIYLFTKGNVLSVIHRSTLYTQHSQTYHLISPQYIKNGILITVVENNKYHQKLGSQIYYIFFYF